MYKCELAILCHICSQLPGVGNGLVAGVISGHAQPKIPDRLADGFDLMVYGRLIPEHPDGDQSAAACTFFTCLDALPLPFLARWDLRR